MDKAEDVEASVNETVAPPAEWQIPEKREVFRLSELARTDPELYTRYIERRPLSDGQLVMLAGRMLKGRRAALEPADSPADMVARGAEVFRGEQAKWQIVLYNIGFAYSLAKRTMPIVFLAKYKEVSSINLSFEDRAQAAIEGLIDAVNRYEPDPESGIPEAARFRSYMRHRMIGEIKEAIYNDLYLPKQLQLELTRFRKIEHSLAQKLGRGPLKKEMIEELLSLGWKEEQIARLEKAQGFTSRIALTEVEELQADRQAVQAGNSILEDIDFVTRAVESLEDPRQRLVITLMYGLLGNEPMTQREIGELLGLSQNRVNQIENKALEKIRVGLYQEQGIAKSPEGFKELKKRIIYDS